MILDNAYCGRFHFALDMNGDGVFTVSDVWAFIEAVFRIPAKVVVELLAHASKLADFFEMDCATGLGGGAVIFSAFAWLMIFFIVASGLDEMNRSWKL